MPPTRAVETSTPTLAEHCDADLLPGELLQIDAETAGEEQQREHALEHERAEVEPTHDVDGGGAHDGPSQSAARRPSDMTKRHEGDAVVVGQRMNW